MDLNPLPMLIDLEALRYACTEALQDSGYAKCVDSQPFAPTNLQIVEQIGSTNQALMALPFGADGPAGPQLLVAWRQVAGRGRQGRVWNSPPQASLTFSIALERVAGPTAPVGWPIAAGVGIAESLQPWVEDIRLKWPNDLQRQARKCGGILAETRRQAGDGCSLERVVTGIGLNLLPDPLRDELAGQPTIALFDTLANITREQVIARVFASVCRQWQAYLRDGLGDNASRWRPFDALRGREVAVIDNGQTLFSGLADGIDETGALRVDCDGRIQIVTVGDVSVRRVA